MPACCVVWEVVCEYCNFTKLHLHRSVEVYMVQILHSGSFQLTVFPLLANVLLLVVKDGSWSGSYSHSVYALSVSFMLYAAALCCAGQVVRCTWLSVREGSCYKCFRKWT